MSSPRESWDTSAKADHFFLFFLWEKGYFQVQVKEFSGKAFCILLRVGIFITIVEILTDLPGT